MPFHPFTVCFFLLCCYSCTTENNSKDLVQNGALLSNQDSLIIDIEEEVKINTEERVAYFSKSEIKNIRLVSYKVDTSGSSESYIYPFEISDNDLMTKLRLHDYEEILVLNEEQKNAFQNILVSLNNTEPIYSSDCYVPHHCFHFLGEDDVLIDYLEICFHCSGYKTSNQNLSILTYEQLSRIGDFIKLYGIKVGFK